jgi:hypothetical protein
MKIYENEQFLEFKNEKKSSKENSEEKENQICIQTIKKEKKQRKDTV